MNPLALIILDGWGIRKETVSNGIALARKPNFDHYWETYPHTQLEASGPAVGLPEGIMGNSEVGHMNLGAGRIVFTGLSQIYQAIEDGTFFSNPALLEAIYQAKKPWQEKKPRSLHLMGLVSNGAVHSHEDHLYALLKLAKREGLSQVFVHCFMDGRDTAPQDGIHAIRRLEEKMEALKLGQIASIIGRYYAMDRDNRWDRIQTAYEALTGIGSGSSDAGKIVQDSYSKGLGDEFICPMFISDHEKPVGAIQDGDSVIFFNFRADRARQLTKVITQNLKVHFVCMAPYEESLNLPVAFKPNYPKKTFGEIVSQKGFRQLRIAETEKYAHVTYFFSGGLEAPFPFEQRILIPSAREVATYDQKPEMGALQITEAVLNQLKEKKSDVIVLNFANPDMLGHTAIASAIQSGVEIVDECLGKIVTEILKQKGQVVITSDHGNAEEMVDIHGQPHTSHTLNPVPFILVSEKNKKASLKLGRLCDVAPTLLALMGLDQPPEMTGFNLIA